MTFVLYIASICFWLLAHFCGAERKISLQECQRTHRAHPGSRTKFQMLDGKFWIEVDCGFLVWNQNLCQCTYDKMDQKNKCNNFVKGEAPGSYKRWNGLVWESKDCNQFIGKKTMIWNEEKCICDWGPDGRKTIVHPKEKIPAKNCVVMLNITFDAGFFDNAHQSWIERRNIPNSELVQDPATVGSGQAACFDESPMLSAYFIENSLTNNFNIAFSFKICQKMVADDRLQSLFHNSCYIEGDGVISPTISLSFQPKTGLFIIDIDTEHSVIPITDSCVARIDDSVWNTVEMTYQNDILILSVNHQICLKSTFFKGNVKRFHCPLILPGEDFCGCLDEVIIRRGCL